jgi:F0F1-type ATP synthase assembly protein I
MIKNFLDDESDQASQRETGSTKPARPADPTVISIFDSVEDPTKSADEPYILSSSPKESAAETIRRSGMAWSIGVAFVCSVGFLLILGWGADLLFGSSPWGVVAGIIIGSLIGFYQLFRFSSQIFKE